MTQLLPTKYLCLLILVFSFAQAAPDPSLFGNLILDAMSTNPTDFELELELWQASGLTGTSKYFECGGSPYLGGKNAFQNGGYLERVYSDLPSHSIIYYAFKLMIIDLWDVSNFFSVYIDNTAVIQNWNPGLSQAEFTSHFCGDSAYKDRQNLFVRGKVNHGSSTLKLKIVFNLASSPLSGGIGFRAMNLQLVQGTPGEAEESTCLAVVTSSVVTISGVPNCALGWNKYLDSYGNPQTCSGPCIMCFGPAQCYLLETGYTFDGTQPIACDSSCTKCSGPDADQCTVCTGTNPYVWNYWDYTCRATCDYPNTQEGNTIKRCLAPCQSQETFALWDNSCSATCDSPLVQRIEGRAKFCDFPCAATQMVASDSSCASLSSPCEIPATLLTIAGRQICKSPCQTISDFYYEKDGSCKSTCAYPYKIEIKSLVKVCKLDISTEAANQAEQIAELTGISALAAKAAGMVVSFINANNAGLLFMASMTEILQYIRYLRINYPPKLQRVLDEQTENLDSLSLINTPSFVEDTFPLNEMPEEFAKNNLHSSFCVNFWQSLALLAIIIAVLPIVCLLEIIAKNIKLLQPILNKIRSSLQWNLILSIFCSAYGTIALYTIVEFRTTSIDSVASGLSLLTNCIINGIGLFILVTILRFCVNFQKVKRKPVRRGTVQRQIDKFLESWKRYEVLYDSYKDNSAFQQMFIFMFMLRTYLHYAIVAIFNDYPFYQTITLTIISVLILLYLIFKRSMKSVCDYIQQLICEVAILIVNICVLILAAMEKWNTGTDEVKEKIGDAIIGVQIALTAVLLLFLAIEIIVAIKGVWSSCKTKPDRLQDRHLIPVRPLNNSALSINLENSNSPSQASRMYIDNSILDQSIEKQIERVPQIVRPPQKNDLFHMRNKKRMRRRGPQQ